MGNKNATIDPSAASTKALRMWLPRTAVSVGHFHLIQLANQTLSQQVRGRRGRVMDPAWVHRMLLLRDPDGLSDQARAKLESVFATDDPARKLKAAWDMKKQVWTLLRTGSLKEAELAKQELERLVKESN